jgi:hypothetical protein
MALTFDNIATVTLSSATNVVTFSSIPQTYTDLRIYCSAIATVSNTYIRFNNDSTTNNYLTGEIFTEPTTGVAISEFTAIWNGYISQWDQTAQSHSILDVFNYTNTSKFKNTFSHTGEGRTTFTTRGVAMTGGTWKNTSAINSISYFAGSAGNWSIGSVFALYGIKAA